MPVKSVFVFFFLISFTINAQINNENLVTPDDYEVNIEAEKAHEQYYSLEKEINESDFKHMFEYMEAYRNISLGGTIENSISQVESFLRTAESALGMVSYNAIASYKCSKKEDLNARWKFKENEISQCKKNEKRNAELINRDIKNYKDVLKNLKEKLKENTATLVIKEQKDDFWDGNETNTSNTTTNNDDFWDENEENATNGGDDFWNSDRLQVRLNAPLNNSISNKNVIDFSASYNIESDAFVGYLNYNGIKQRVKPENGIFTGKIILKSGNNDINFSIRSGATIVYQENFNVNYTGKPVKLKATLVWDSKADIDLYLKDSNNDECYYSNKLTQLATLDVDNTDAYGPENISVESITSGEYSIYIKNYSKTSGVKVTVYIFLNEELESVTEHVFSRSSNDFFVKSFNF